jgi:KDO2-lipid IV(A) lauroyltransferase
MVQFENFELIEKYFAEGKSILAATGHVGNWELCVVALSTKLKNKQNKVIYKPLNNPVFEEWFYKLRSRFGNDMITMRQTLRSVVASKNEQTIYCFAGDQSPVRSEVQYNLEFLNQTTAVLLGLEKIALQTNRPIIYFEVDAYKRGKYLVKIRELCEVPQVTKGHQITDMFFHELEKTIKAQPVHWLWSHRRWKLNK